METPTPDLRAAWPCMVRQNDADLLRTMRRHSDTRQMVVT